jgi:hypothetical protein
MFKLSASLSRENVGDGHPTPTTPNPKLGRRLTATLSSGTASDIAGDIVGLFKAFLGSRVTAARLVAYLDGS